MPAKPTLAKYNNLVNKLVRAIRKQANEECQKKWKLAFVDARAIGGGSSVMKYRIELSNGNAVVKVHASRDASDSIHELVQMKDSLFEPNWHGIRVTVFPNGRFETEYDHDPDCANDPTFFDN